MQLNDFKDVHQIANSIQNEIRDAGLFPRAKKEDIISLFDSVIIEPILRDTCRQLFLNGHFALAVEEAFKCINNHVKKRSGLTNDGADLMRSTFSPKKPVLKLNNLKTKSQRNQQLGYMDIFAGSMTGIRNPRAHEHKYLDEQHVAIEMLSLANHLIRLVNNSKKSRKRKN